MLPQTASRAIHTSKGIWMAPGAKRGDLLYISEYGGGVVDVFTFPQGKLVGEITGFINPQGECVDEKGDVFIVNASVNFGQPSIEEFAHGGAAPIQTLSDNDQEPYGCSVDPVTGNLAVGNQSGSVALYQNAQGAPTFLADHNMTLGLWVGYDDRGNLFFDGLNDKIATEFDEVPKGQTKFTPMTLSRTVGFPGNIQWDGSQLTLGDALYQGKDTSAIYQLKISGSNAAIVGTTVLNGSVEVFGSWIRGKRVVGPEEGRSDDRVDYWPYPAGGNATKSLAKSFNGPFGAVVSPGAR